MATSPFHRVQLVQLSELSVGARRLHREFPRPLEEGFSHDREELRGITGAVAVDHRRGLISQPLKSLVHHVRPPPPLRRIRPPRPTIGYPRVLIDLVRELVKCDASQGCATRAATAASAATVNRNMGSAALAEVIFDR